MKILAIDTSTSTGSVALVEDGRLLLERMTAGVVTYADWLLCAIDSLLNDAGCTVKDIDIFAVGAGPGLFTGLRIGISTAKGLAWALGKGCAPVSTLEALALNAPYSDITVCPLLDARKGEVYAALYRRGLRSTDVIMKDSLLTPDALFHTINSSDTPRPVLFLGAGLGAYADAVKKNMNPDDYIIAPEPLWHVRASNIALLAMRGSAGAIAPFELLPTYLRRP